MSIKRTAECTCPFCGSKQDLVFWDYINTRDDPELKAQVRNADIFNIPCKSCGRMSRFAYPILYQDPDKRLIVGLLPERTEQAAKTLLQRLQMSDLIGPRMRGYTIRGVTQPGELSEKITITEHALDDRVVELYKLIVCEHFSEEMGREPDRVFLHEDEKLHFLLLSEESTDVYSADFIRDNYDEVRSRFAGFFPAGLLPNVFVDNEWTHGMLQPTGTAH